MNSETDDDYNELCAYTLSLRDPTFIHQHVVDAYAAQNAGKQTKTITLTFALVGLYLHAERQFTGRQVQLAHMRLARTRQTWPRLVIPDSENRGILTVHDVMAAPPGPQRDQAILDWASSVWSAFVQNRNTLAELLRQVDIL